MPLGHHVLLVDDEPLIAMLMEDAFLEHGFAVTVATSSKAALDVLTGDAPIGCLVTDIRMPGKVTGWDIAEAGRRQRPDLQVVYYTGDSLIDFKTRAVPNSRIFGKPVSVDDVVETVRALLAAPALSN